MNYHRHSRRLASLLISAYALFQVPGAVSADLDAKTVDAYNQYVRVTEARIQEELSRPGEFLYLEGLPESQRSAALASLRKGEIYMEQLHTRGASGKPLAAPHALIHHWIGAVFVPGASLVQILELVEDYDHHQDFYQPEVVRSQLVKHEGNNYQIYYRLRKKKVITVTLNTNHDVEYTPVDSTHCHSRSVATRIAEVANADEPGEHEKPIGHDGGFLWRMNSYWRFEEKDQGVYVEVESVSLTRDIPTGLADKTVYHRHPA